VEVSVDGQAALERNLHAAEEKAINGLDFHIFY
jgi:hypothetical protein